jgi:hypothetical protein
MNAETTNSLIDTALASGQATALDAEERTLQELVLAIHDDAPTPAADFRLRMDARVAAGFPPRRARRVKLPAFAMKRPRMAALGAAASVLIALVAVASFDGRSDNGVPAVSGTPTPAESAGGGSASSDTATQSAPGATEDRAAAPAAKAAPNAAGGSAESELAAPTTSTSTIAPIAPVPPGDTGDVRGGSNRRVQRSASLVLVARRDHFNDVGAQILAVTDRYRGIVMQSSITDTTDGGTGTYDLRIPVRNLPAALRDLSQLADVQSRTENADDVTASFVTARTRIQELKAERRRLLRKLAATTDDNQAGVLRARIRFVNSELDAATRSLHGLSRRTSFATVAVTLTTKKGGLGGGGISDGARDLRDSLIDSANIALRVLGVAIPIGIVLGLLWAANGWTLRRRREAALDSRL